MGADPEVTLQAGISESDSGGRGFPAEGDEQRSDKFPFNADR